MLGFGFAIIVALFFLFSLGVLGSLWSAQRQMFDLFKGIAKRQDGSLTGTNRQPAVYFNENGVGFIVKGRMLNGKSTLTVHSAWPEPGFRAKFFPETISDAMKKFIGMQDIKIGNPKFDSRFVVQTNNVERLMEVLQPESQKAIYSLGKQAVLNISGAKIQLEHPANFSDRVSVNRTIRRFVDAYFVLTKTAVDLSTLMQVTAISIDEKDAVCMICGEDIDQRRVHCRRCQTPHHHECWEYLGQCSTYGCGEKRWQTSSKVSKLRIR